MTRPATDGTTEPKPELELDERAGVIRFNTWGGPVRGYILVEKLVEIGFWRPDQVAAALSAQQSAEREVERMRLAVEAVRRLVERFPDDGSGMVNGVVNLAEVYAALRALDAATEGEKTPPERTCRHCGHFPGHVLHHGRIPAGEHLMAPHEYEPSAYPKDEPTPPKTESAADRMARAKIDFSKVGSVAGIAEDEEPKTEGGEEECPDCSGYGIVPGGIDHLAEPCGNPVHAPNEADEKLVAAAVHKAIGDLPVTKMVPASELDDLRSQLADANAVIERAEKDRLRFAEEYERLEKRTNECREERGAKIAELKEKLVAAEAKNAELEAKLRVATELFDASQRDYSTLRTANAALESENRQLRDGCESVGVRVTALARERDELLKEARELRAREAPEKAWFRSWLRTAEWIREHPEEPLEGYVPYVPLVTDEPPAAAQTPTGTEPWRTEGIEIRGLHFTPADIEAVAETVRIAWVEWAKVQPNPKPHWLVPWASLSEADKNADRFIGVFLMRRMGEWFADAALEAVKEPPAAGKSKERPRMFPVTDPDRDAPDGAVVDGYRRSGDQWIRVEDEPPSDRGGCTTPHQCENPVMRPRDCPVHGASRPGEGEKR